MSDFRIGSGPFFERGIDSITFKGNDSAQVMPDQPELVPAEQGQRPQLEQLLSMPSLDAFLDDLIRPDIEDRELLMPQKFRQAMDGAMAEIGRQAQEMQSNDPETTKVLNRATRLLNEEVGLRDLLQMYRSVLFQG
jgi:type III secretion protein X